MPSVINNLERIGADVSCGGCVIPPDDASYKEALSDLMRANLPPSRLGTTAIGTCLLKIQAGECSRFAVVREMVPTVSREEAAKRVHCQLLAQQRLGGGA